MVPLMSRPEVLSLAEKYGRTNAQIVLRWQVQHGRVVIPKSEHIDRLKTNLDIFDFELSEEDMKTLDNLKPQARHSTHPGFRCTPAPFFKEN